MLKMDILRRTFVRSVFSSRSQIRKLACSSALLNSDQEQFNKVLKNQRIVQDETYEPNETLASGKTTITFLSKEFQDGMINFDSFSSVGFRLNNGLRVMGPCAAFPRSLLHWNISDVKAITPESLALFTILEPKIDILVLGIGEAENIGKVDHKIVTYLRSHKISVEILPTEQALTTFNFLNNEKRYVAGAFLPPAYIADIDDEDKIRTLQDHGYETSQLPTDIYEQPEIGPGEFEGGNEAFKKAVKEGFRNTINAFHKESREEYIKRQLKEGKDPDDYK